MFSYDILYWYLAICLATLHTHTHSFTEFLSDYFPSIKSNGKMMAALWCQEQVWVSYCHNPPGILRWDVIIKMQVVPLSLAKFTLECSYFHSMQHTREPGYPLPKPPFPPSLLQILPLGDGINPPYPTGLLRVCPWLCGTSHHI